MKKLFTLLLMLFAVISTQAAAPDRLFIVGTANVGIGTADWNYTPASSGSVEMTKDGNKFTANVTLTDTAWFCFGEEDGSSWDIFNDNYSWRPSTNDFIPTEGTPVIMSHGRDNSFKLGAGEYTFTVDFSGTAPTFTLSGKAEEVVITGYSVIGAKALFGGEDDFDTDLDMTESSTGVYTATVSNVPLAANSYEYKARANHKWGIAEYPASGNTTLNIGEDGFYDIVFTLTLENSTITATPEKKGDLGFYLVGEFNGWAVQDAEYKFTKREDGKFELTLNNYEADSKFKIIDDVNRWYGSVETGNEDLAGKTGEISLNTEGGIDNNFYVSVAGGYKITLDVANKKFTIAPTAIELPALEGTNYRTFGNKDYAVSFAGIEGIEVSTVTYDAAVGCTRKHVVASKQVPANTAVVLFKETGFTEALTLPVIENPAVLGDNDLKVSDGSILGAEGIFCLSNGAKGLGFYPVADGVQVPANKAYLDLSNSPLAPKFIGFPDETTGIDALENGEATAEKAGAIYTLDGRRVNGNLSHGLYIQNGKKFVVK